jgi:hypothetical protein
LALHFVALKNKQNKFDDLESPERVAVMDGGPIVIDTRESDVANAGPNATSFVDADDLLAHGSLAKIKAGVFA